jgi:A/G-specific adenine glycosylase
MLQQTQVDTVIPYFERFLAKFPSVGTLARSDLHDVLMAWENLGYYARARHIHEAAKIISQQYAGKIPDTQEEILRLPGIGRYTAGAILSIAFGKPVPAVDGNVRRVFSRLFAVREPVDKIATQRHLQLLVEGLIPAHDPGTFNQALMDLGAMICTPKNPVCSACPLQTLCRAYSHEIQHLLPAKGKKSPVPHKDAVAVILYDLQNRILLVRRPLSGFLGGLWKLPGGFLYEGETLSHGLNRTVREEVGLNIAGEEFVAAVKHTYTHFHMTLNIFCCSRPFAERVSPECRTLQWTFPDDFEKIPFSKAERKALSAFSHKHPHMHPSSMGSK